jgi:predicted MFS family arabinose efflux permease
MVWVNLGLALALLPIFAIDVTGIWIVYAVLLVSNVLEQLFVPAEVALLPQLVGPEHLISANSLSSLNRNLARLVGPAVGGVAIALGGLSFAIGIDVATFVIAAALIALIGPGKSFRAESQVLDLSADEPTNVPPRGLRKLITEMREGFSVALGKPMLRALLAFALLGAIGEGFLGALFVPWVSDILHGDQFAWAAILSAQAVGGLIGAVFVGRYLSRVRPAYLLGFGTLIFAAIDLAIFTYPLVLPIVLPAILGMVVVGIPISALGVGNTTLQQSLTSDSHRGRVVGIVGTLQALGMVSGTIIAGLFGQAIGLIPMMALDSLLYATGGVIVLLTARRSEVQPVPTTARPTATEPA